jgi:hypothetical protein
LKTETLDRVTAMCPCGAQVVFSNFRGVREYLTLRDRCPECQRMINLRLIVTVVPGER